MKRGGEMQQKLCSRGTGSLFLERNGPACGAGDGSITGPSSIPQLPFRCPRCGEQERFRSLASLRAHLEYRHSYYTLDNATGSTTETSWHELSLPTRRGQQSAVRMFHVRSLSDSRDGSRDGSFLSYSSERRDSSYLYSYSLERRRTQSVGVGTQEEEGEMDEEEEEDDEEEEAEANKKDSDLKSFTKKSELGHHHRHHNHHHFPYPPPAPLGPLPTPPDPRDSLETLEQSLYPGLEAAAASTAVRRRLASVLRAADSTMQRRLARVSTELAQTDTELLCERALSQHLAQERQEVAERERSLSRQVDVAVMVIATLREQLNASENELERREREVITIQNFLEAATRQETFGKVRIQHFIENLLKRIALAERLVEYYQGNVRPPHCNHYKHQQPTENGPHRITKSRSAGGQLSSSGLYDNRTPSSQFLGHAPFSKPARDRDREREQWDRLAQSSRLFCRPEHRDDIWNHQRRRSAGYES